MTMYLCLFIIMILIWGIIYSKPYEIRDVTKKRSCIFIASLLITVAALRGASVGTDTSGYIRDYNVVTSITYTDLLVRYSDNPGYYLLSKLFAECGFPIQIWFGFIEFLFVGAVTKLIFRFSKDPALSYIMFLALDFYGFSLAGLKQILGMSIVLWSFNYIYDKKYIRAIILVIFSSLFHASSLIFIFAIMNAIMTKSRKIYVYLTIIFAVTIFNYASILNWFLGLLGNNHYIAYLQTETSYSPTVFIVQLLIFLASLIYMKAYSSENEKESTMLYSMTYLGVIAQMFAFAVASAFRVSMYFSIFSIILYPNALDQENDSRLRRLLKLGSVFALISYFAYVNRYGSSTVPYVFYWS